MCVRGVKMLKPKLAPAQVGFSVKKRDELSNGVVLSIIGVIIPISIIMNDEGFQKFKMLTVHLIIT